MMSHGRNRNIPIFAFRPMESAYERYADGQWLPDDGKTFDLAFIASPNHVLWVHLPGRENIMWSYRTSYSSWPTFHHLLRHGSHDLGRYANRWIDNANMHPNEKAGRLGMERCSKRHGCASGGGPEFNVGDPYFARDLVRYHRTGRPVPRPVRFNCFECQQVHYLRRDWLPVIRQVRHERAQIVEAALARSG